MIGITIIVLVCLAVAAIHVSDSWASEQTGQLHHGEGALASSPTHTPVHQSETEHYPRYWTASTMPVTSGEAEGNNTEACDKPRQNRVMDITGTSAGDGTIELNWTHHRVFHYWLTGGPTVGFTIDVRSPPQSGDYTTVADVDAWRSFYSYTVENLTNGQEYEFRVTAYTYVDEVCDTARATPAGPPKQPQNLYATWHSNTVILTWDAPNDNGSPVTGYSVAARIGKTNPFSTLGKVPASDGSFGHTYRAEGLTNGMPYEFAVFAKNNIGTGPPATIIATPVGPPDPPLNFTATESNGEFILTWDAPNDNGSPITSYQISAIVNGFSFKWIGDFPATTTSYTVTDLSYESKVKFQIQAVNSHSRGPYASVTLTPSG